MAPLGHQLLNYYQYFDWQWSRGIHASELPGTARTPFTLLFLALAVLASLANCVHCATLIAEGASCLADSDLTAMQHRQINDNFIFYGTSQAPPPLHALHPLR